jgi:hypothetical protein
MASAPTGFYDYRTSAGRQYPVWMNSGTAPTRAPRMQAAPEYENLPAVVTPQPATPNLLAPQPMGMAQGFAQPEGGGGGYGAPAQSNTTFGDFMNALGFDGFGSANSTTSGTGPETNAVGGDIGGGPQGDFGGQMAGLAGMYRGGIVTPNRLQGHNPPGPDDGLVPMDIGEGVLTAKAIQHYGPGIVARLNKLAVPKAAFAKR